MATGISKNQWQEDSHIINTESYEGDYSYELIYPSKLSIDKIVNTQNQCEYEFLLNQKSKNKLVFGENLDVLRYLIHQNNLANQINLIYIDPPYGTNSVFASRNQKSSYKDDLVGSHYLEFIRRRLVLLRELLSDSGSIYIHLDGNMAFQVKVIMDEIFSVKNCRGIISRKKCSNKNSTRKTYGNISDYIFFYSKTSNYTWNRATEPWSEEKIRKEYPCIDEKSGRRYKKVPIHAPGTRNGETGKAWKGMLPPKGKHWQYTPEKLTQLDQAGDIYWSSNGNPRRKVYFDRKKGVPVQDIWMDVQDSLNQNIKITGYPTEKNPRLLERIINASSKEGDIVLDCFAGSGTTLDVAEQLGRNFIGIDNSSQSISTIIKRFVLGLEEMGDYVQKRKNESSQFIQNSLFEYSKEDMHHKSSRREFDVLSDKRYSSEIVDILDRMKLIDKSKIHRT